MFTYFLEFYIDVIQRLKKLIDAVGKKSYLISVGKPNPAKLGNYLEIDAFIFVACPQSTITLAQSKEYMNPIITPFELEIALTSLAEDSPETGNVWIPFVEGEAGRYVMNFGQIAHRLQTQISKNPQRTEPHFSLVSGKMSYVEPLHTVQEVETTEDGQLVHVTGTREVATISQSPAALYLNTKRTYQGLDPQLALREPSKIEQGRSGIAKGYSAEGTQ